MSKVECVWGFVGSVGWVVLICVVDGVGGDERITFEIDSVSDMVSSDG